MLLFAGTIIAIFRVAMRLSEVITIYLAIGAPFGASKYLQKSANESGTRKLLKALAASLSWPLVIWRILVASLAKSSPAVNVSKVSNNENIYRTKRRLLAAINALNELTDVAIGPEHEELERAACVLRESIETYVGLAPALDDSDDDNSSRVHSKELFRIAGRKGDDLLLATQCAERRNLARIVEHYTRARIRLVESVDDIREAIECVRPQIIANGIAERRLSIAVVELYKNGFDLLLLMGDDGSAMRISDLLNRELSRLRRLEIMEKHTEVSQGEEPCKAHTSRPSRAPLSSESTLARG